MSEREIDFNRYFVISEQERRDLPMHIADRITGAIDLVEDYYASEKKEQKRRLVIEENCDMYSFVEADLLSYINGEGLAYNRIRNTQEALVNELGLYLHNLLRSVGVKPLDFVASTDLARWKYLSETVNAHADKVREAYPGAEVGGHNAEANTAHMIAQQARENNEQARIIEHDKRTLDNAWQGFHKRSAELGKDIQEWADTMEEYVLGKPAYHGLMSVLREAYWQAAEGKGAERHAGKQVLPFPEQPIFSISRMLNSPEGLRYQIIKKIGESKDLVGNAKTRELFGAIVYTAALVMFERERLELMPDDTDIKRQQQLIRDLNPDWLLDMKPNGAAAVRQRGETSDDESKL